ncbi:MAG: RHS repeat-associated core domain-containing protein [Lentisphaeria bacterium]
MEPATGRTVGGRRGVFAWMWRSTLARVGSWLMLLLACGWAFRLDAVAQEVAVAATADARPARPLVVNEETGRPLLAALDAVLVRGNELVGVGRAWLPDQPALGLGPGWRLSCDEQVVARPAAAVLHTAEGDHHFLPAGAGRWTSRDGVRSSLLRTDAGFRWERPGRIFHEYDSRGLLVKATYPRNGFTVERQAGDPGLALAVVAPDGRKLTLEIADGRYAAVSDPAGGRWRFNYDAAGRLAAVERPAGGRERYAYDAKDRLALVDLGFGKVELEYDAMGHVIAQRSGETLLGRWSYAGDAGAWEVRAEQPLGVATLFRRSADGRRRDWTSPAGDRIEARADGRGLPVLVSENGRETFSAETDPDGRYRGIRAEGRETAFSWTAEGLFAGLREAGGRELALEYDAAGRPTLARGSDGGQAAWQWDAAGHCVRMTAQEPGGAPRELIMAYDAAGNLRRLEAGGRKLELTPDVLGRTVRVEGDGRALEVTYDAESCPVRVTEGGTILFQAGYDSRGLPVKLAGRGGEARFEFGPDGRLAGILDPAGRRTAFRHDAFGRLAGVANPAGNLFGFGYDAWGRVNRARLPGAGEAAVEFDAADRPVRLTLPGGGALAFAYHESGALQRLDGGPLGRVEYQLGLGGRSLEGWKDTAGEEASRDESGVAWGQAGVPCPVQTRFRRTAAGARQTVTLKHEEVSRRLFDPAGRLVRIEGAAGVFRFETDPRGRRTAAVFPNGVRQEYGYDREGRLATLALRGADGSAIQGWTYSYDGAGRCAKVAASDGTVRQYAYDQVGRLAEVSDAAGQMLERFAYDAAGRLAAAADRTADLHAELDAEGRLLAWGGRRFTVDAAGRRVAESAPGGASRTFTHDALGRLTRFTAADGATDFGYSLPGRLLWSSQAAGAKEHRLYSGADLVAVADPQGNVRTTYVNGVEPDEVLAVRGTDGRWLYHHRDPLQSLRRVTDAAGKTVATFDYTAFGTPVTPAAAEHNPLFAGRHWFPAAGLYENRARWYDPGTGRFLTPDPAGLLGGLAPFAYADGNPVAYRDPTGRVIPFVVIGIGMAVGGGLEIVNQYLTNEPDKPLNWWKIGSSTAFGGITGGLGAAFQGVKAAIIIGSSSGLIKTFVDNWCTGESFSWANLLLNTVLGGATAGLFSQYGDQFIKQYLVNGAFWQAVKERFGYAGLKNVLNLINTTVSGVIDTVVGNLKDSLLQNGVPQSLVDTIKATVSILAYPPLDPFGGPPGGPLISPWSTLQDLLTGGGDVLGGGTGGGLPGAAGGGRPAPVRLDRFR